MSLHRTIVRFGVVAGFGFAGSAMGAVVYPANNGFEVNDLGSGGNAYEYGTVPGWTVSSTTGGVGEAANGSAFGVSGATNGNSDGTTSTAGQAALLQGGDGTLTGSTWISQSLGLGAGTASVSFSAENRNCCSGGVETVNVYLDGNLIDTVTPPVNSFQDYTTPDIAVTAGTHTIAFAGSTSGGDQTAFIDNVSINNAVPEPATLGLIAAIPLALLRRSRRA